MMLCRKPLPLSLPTTIFLLPLFLSPILLTFSHGHGDDSHSFPPSLLAPTSGWETEKERDIGELWWTRSSIVVEGPAAGVEPAEEVSSSSIVLAAERTNRKDPLNGFKRYTGGWNISERHYWASVGFTAVPLFVIAIGWFLGFGLCLALICLCYFCCVTQPHGYSRTAYALSLILLVVFSIAAIIGCVVLYAGQEKFHRSTTNTLEYLVNQADVTVGRLRNVSDYLASAKQIGVDKIFLPSNVQTDIDQIETKINSSASTLADAAVKKSDDIRDLLDSVRLTLIIVAAIMLVLTFLGFLFSVFGMQFLVYILVITGWLLVAGTFILCGTFLLLHNVAADTCVAMNEWAQNPTAHSALDEILPCVDNATAQETLLRSKEVTSELVDLVNEVITNVSNINFAPSFVPFYFNQSGPLVPILCNPFYPDLSDRPCSPGEVDLTNAAQVWSGYVCQVSSSGICTTRGRLNPTFYDQMTSAIDVCLALRNYAPFLVELEDCTFVRETFSDIHQFYCPSLRNYSRWIYVGLVMVSTAVMLSLIFWVIYGRERRHRVLIKRLMAESSHGLERQKDSR